MKRKLLSTLAMLSIPLTMASMSQERPTRRVYEPTPKGYEHEGMYSQSKKLRKGAGHKKLTRAQRKAKKYVRNH